LNASIISAIGGASGYHYSFYDSDCPCDTLYYWLETIAYNGINNVLGPIDSDFYLILTGKSSSAT
jgi:hypothetical protein